MRLYVCRGWQTVEKLSRIRRIRDGKRGSHLGPTPYSNAFAQGGGFPYRALLLIPVGRKVAPSPAEQDDG